MAVDLVHFKPFNVKGLIELNTILKATDKKLITELRAELKDGIVPVATKLQYSIPSQAPLSGMYHKGRSAWGTVKASVSFTPRASIRGRLYQPLVSVVVTGKKALGFDYAELAGLRRRKPPGQSRVWVDQYGKSRRTKQNGQGDAFIRGLGSKPGRYASPVIRRERPFIERTIMEILEKFATKVNRKIDQL